MTSCHQFLHKISIGNACRAMWHFYETLWHTVVPTVTLLPLLNPCEILAYLVPIFASPCDPPLCFSVPFSVSAISAVPLCYFVSIPVNFFVNSYDMPLCYLVTLPYSCNIFVFLCVIFVNSCDMPPSLLLHHFSCTLLALFVNPYDTPSCPSVPSCSSTISAILLWYFCLPMWQFILKLGCI